MSDDPSRLVETRLEGRVRGVVSQRDTAGRIETRLFEPPSDLVDVVERFWSGRWDFRDRPPHINQQLNDPCMHIVFERGGDHAGSRLVGVWTRLWQRELEGRGLVRGAKLRPGAARALVDTPAHRFRDRILPLAEVFADVHLAALERRVLEPEDDEHGFEALAGWLRERRLEDANVSLVGAIVRRIASDGAITSVEQLSTVAGLSPRPLQRLFRDYIGASPKWVIRRNRLQEVARRLERGEATNLAALAAELGYSDQAHLAHDFKNAVGKSPSAYREQMG